MLRIVRGVSLATIATTFPSGEASRITLRTESPGTNGSLLPYTFRNAADRVTPGRSVGLVCVDGSTPALTDLELTVPPTRDRN